MTSAGRTALDLVGGARVVFQRVPRGTQAEDFARSLSAELDRPVQTSEQVRPVTDDEHIVVVDGRALTAAEATGLDAWRPAFEAAPGVVVVLVDVGSEAVLLEHAPHLTSWAGGVWLPAERHVRYTETEAELERGHDALVRALRRRADGGQSLIGLSVGVDLATERLFVPTPAVDALTLARWALDEGLLHVERIYEVASP